MVYFTCQHCGESVNKPRVVKHYDTKCRFKTPHLTCVDCLKDFHDQEYNAHTQCVSEAQRYSAKGTIIKEPLGRKKQDLYMEVVKSLLNTKKLTYVQNELLQVCASHDNVPRKLNKFQNFMSNAARSIRHTKQDEEYVFRLMESAWKRVTRQQTKISEAKDEKKVDGKTEISNEGNKTEDENISNNLNTSNSSSNSVSESKKNKIKKQKSEVDKKMDIEFDTNTTSEKSKENLNGLTKKQLKKQKKYEKYLTELQSEVQNEENENKEIGSDEELKKTRKKSKKLKTQLENGFNNQNTETRKTTETVEEVKQKKSKKLKVQNAVNWQGEEASTEISKEESHENYTKINNKNKKKSKKSKRQQTNLELNGNTETENSLENTKSETIKKKNKKRKMEETIIETAEERKKARMAEDEGVIENQTTFDWTSVILRVLESIPDKELSIKRLGKKVIDEYQTIRPDHRNYEELLAVFNKKVKKTRGVRVLKDKAKLVE